ncbi:MAG: hypothetical protein Kow0042_23140 [Calditrichia bacterium]
MKDEVKVGMTIVVAIILFIAMMVVLKNVSLHESGYRINVRLNDAAGILKGDPVAIAGVQVGRVEEIWLENNRVFMRLWINNKFKLATDSRASVKTLSMMGEKYIAIQPGNSQSMLNDGDTIEGLAAGDLTDIAADVQPIIVSLKKILQQLENFPDDGTKENVRKTVNNLQQLSQNLDRVIDQSGRSLEQSTRNIEVFSHNLKLLSQNNRQPVDSIVANLNKSSRAFASSSENLACTIKNLEEITSQINSQNGTLGKLVYDERVYRQLDSLLSNTNKLILDIQKNPKKYLKISLF